MAGYIDTVVNIGTGREKLLDPDGYLHNLILSFVQRATNTEAQHQVLNDDAFKDVRAGYFRFPGFRTRGDRSCGCREVGRHREVSTPVSRLRE
jgi:hypothetical protein